jgi:hypothetical protein
MNFIFQGKGKALNEYFSIEFGIIARMVTGLICFFPFEYIVYVSQAIEEISHFRKCLGN